MVGTCVWRKGGPDKFFGGREPGLDPATVAMRNSRDPQGTALIYPATAVRAMISALRSGDFDYLVG